MSPLASRFIGPILVACIMFVSIDYLSGNPRIAGACALVPLLLGSLGILKNLAYGLAGLALIAAVGWGVAPADVKEGLRIAESNIVNQLKTPPAAPTAPAAPPAPAAPTATPVPAPQPASP